MLEFYVLVLGDVNDNLWLPRACHKTIKFQGTSCFLQKYLF